MNRDLELLEGLKNDCRNSLEQLYLHYWEYLFNAAYNLLQDREACEEIVQDTFIALWEKRADLEIRSSLKSYLYGMIRFKVFNHLRSRNKIPHTPFLEELETRMQYSNADSELIFKEYQSFLETVIASLPVKCREVYQLSRIEELSHKEISERLNISPKTVENHINRALKTLRNAIRDFATLFL